MRDSVLFILTFMAECLSVVPRSHFLFLERHQMNVSRQCLDMFGPCAVLLLRLSPSLLVYREPSTLLAAFNASNCLLR